MQAIKLKVNHIMRSGTSIQPTTKRKHLILH